MTTYDDLKRMIYEEQALLDRDDGVEPTLSEEDLFLPGRDTEKEYVDDLLIKLEPESDQPFWIKYRQPGTEVWTAWYSFSTYADMARWVYAL